MHWLRDRAALPSQHAHPAEALPRPQQPVDRLASVFSSNRMTYFAFSVSRAVGVVSCSPRRPGVHALAPPRKQPHRSHCARTCITVRSSSACARQSPRRHHVPHHSTVHLNVIVPMSVFLMS